MGRSRVLLAISALATAASACASSPGASDGAGYGGGGKGADSEEDTRQAHRVASAACAVGQWTPVLELVLSLTPSALGALADYNFRLRGCDGDYDALTQLAHRLLQDGAAVHRQQLRERHMHPRFHWLAGPLGQQVTGRQSAHALIALMHRDLRHILAV